MAGKTYTPFLLITLFWHIVNITAYGNIDFTCLGLSVREKNHDLCIYFMYGNESFKMSKCQYVNFYFIIFIHFQFLDNSIIFLIVGNPILRNCAMRDGKGFVPIKSMHIPFLYSHLKTKVIFKSTFFLVVHLFPSYIDWS